MGGFAKATAIGTGAAAVGTAAKEVGAAAYNIGRTSIYDASERQRARVNAAMVGVDYDRFRAQTGGITKSVTDTTLATNAYLMSGMAARKGEAAAAQDLGTTIATANVAGVSASSAVAANQQLQMGPTFYNLQAMGVQGQTAGGKPADTLNIINQIMQQTYNGRQMTEEDIARGLTPGQGTLWMNLVGAMGQQGAEEFIKANRPALLASGKTGGAATRADIEKMPKPKGDEAQIEAAKSKEAVTEDQAAAVEEGFADATKHLADFNKWLSDLEGPAKGFLEFVNKVGAASETGQAGGMPSWLSTGLGILNALHIIPGFAEGDTDVKSDSVVKVHAGEMILPSRIAGAVRGELGLGSGNKFTPSHEAAFVHSANGLDKAAVMDLSNYAPPPMSTSPNPPPNVNITVNVQSASEEEARRLAEMVQKYLKNRTDLSGVGLGQVFM